MKTSVYVLYRIRLVFLGLGIWSLACMVSCKPASMSRVPESTREHIPNLEANQVTLTLMPKQRDQAIHAANTSRITMFSKSSKFHPEKPGQVTQNPEIAGRAHLLAHYPALSSSTWSDLHLRLKYVHDTGQGPIIAKFKQQIGLVEVFRQEINVVMDRALNLVAISGSPFLSNPAAIDKTISSAFDLDTETAMKRAVTVVGHRLGSWTTTTTASGAGYQHAIFRHAAGATKVRAKPVYYPLAERLVSAYYTEMQEVTGPSEQPQLFGLVISAEDGRVLFRQRKTFDLEPFTYRVYADAQSGLPAISPYCEEGVPYPYETPNGYAPDTGCLTETLSLSHAGLSTGDPWLPDDATETVGNNVDAFFLMCRTADGQARRYDAEYDPTLGDFRASLTGPFTFDYSYDLASAPEDYNCYPDGYWAEAHNDSQLNAKIVQAFFVANFLHDLMYDHGFDEAAGVAQTDNYGRGGLDNDAMQVVAGFGTGALAPADGQSPILLLGIQSLTMTQQDATLDLVVFGHEWMHYMQHRLVGDSHGLANNQGRALGEGWSDFFGLFLIVRPEQINLPQNNDWTGTYPAGAYFNTNDCGYDVCTPETVFKDAWYFGTRRYPYSVDLTKSPLTFGYIKNDVPRPPGIPNYTWVRRVDNAEGHNAGEIWTSALWHCYRALLLDPRWSFDQARSRMLTYLVASLKVTPIDPTFTEARDAMLAVVKATDQQDYQNFQKAFAARGLGAGAVSPPRYSIEYTEVIESFVDHGPALAFIAAELDDSTLSSDDDGVLDVGETGRLVIRMRNTGFESLDAIQVTIAAVNPTPEIAFPSGNSISGLSSHSGEDFEVEFSVALQGSQPYAPLSLTVTWVDTTGRLPEEQTQVHFRVHYDTHRSAMIDDVEYPVSFSDWQVESKPSSRSGYVSRHHRWERDLLQGNNVYRAPAGKARYESALLSPWLMVANDQDFTVSFDHTYDFAKDDGMLYGFGDVWIEKLDTTMDNVANYEGDFGSSTLESVHLDFDQKYAGQVVRLRFQVHFQTSFTDEEAGWWLDNIAFTGLLTTPFSEVHAHAAAGPGVGWPPEASFQFAAQDLLFDFTDTSTDADGEVIKWLWDFGDGGTASEQNPVHTYQSPRERWVTLQVEDDQSVQDVVVNRAEPILPMLSGESHSDQASGNSRFVVDVPALSRSLTISSSGSSGDDFLVVTWYGQVPLFSSYWEYGYYKSGNFDEEIDSIELVIPWPEPGRWYIGTQNNLYGNSSTPQFSLAVQLDQAFAPNAAFTFSAEDLQVVFTDASSDSDGQITSWAWDFGDGNHSDQQSPQHTYTAPGSYTVALTVTDNEDVIDSISQTVVVELPDDPDDPDDPLSCGGCSSSGVPNAAGLILVLWFLLRRRGSTV